MQLNWKWNKDRTGQCGPFEIRRGQHPDGNEDRGVLELHFGGHVLAWAPETQRGFLEARAVRLTAELFANVTAMGGGAREEMGKLAHDGAPGDAMVVDYEKAMAVARAADLALLHWLQLGLAAIRVKRAHDAILLSPRGKPLDTGVALEHLRAQTHLADAIRTLAPEGPPL